MSDMQKLLLQLDVKKQTPQETHFFHLDSQDSKLLYVSKLKTFMYCSSQQITHYPPQEKILLSQKNSKQCLNFSQYHIIRIRRGGRVVKAMDC